jgi:hypothetical protein
MDNFQREQFNGSEEQIKLKANENLLASDFHFMVTAKVQGSEIKMSMTSWLDTLPPVVRTTFLRRVAMFALKEAEAIDEAVSKLFEDLHNNGGMTPPSDVS